MLWRRPPDPRAPPALEQTTVWADDGEDGDEDGRLERGADGRVSAWHPAAWNGSWVAAATPQWVAFVGWERRRVVAYDLQTGALLGALDEDEVDCGPDLQVVIADRRSGDGRLARGRSPAAAIVLRV